MAAGSRAREVGCFLGIVRAGGPRRGRRRPGRHRSRAAGRTPRPRRGPPGEVRRPPARRNSSPRGAERRWTRQQQRQLHLRDSPLSQGRRRTGASASDRSASLSRSGGQPRAPRRAEQRLFVVDAAEPDDARPQVPDDGGGAPGSGKMVFRVLLAAKSDGARDLLTQLHAEIWERARDGAAVGARALLHAAEQPDLPRPLQPVGGVVPGALPDEDDHHRLFSVSPRQALRLAPVALLLPACLRRRVGAEPGRQVRAGARGQPRRDRRRAHRRRARGCGLLPRLMFNKGATSP